MRKTSASRPSLPRGKLRAYASSEANAAFGSPALSEERAASSALSSAASAAGAAALGSRRRGAGIDRCRSRAFARDDRRGIDAAGAVGLRLRRGDGGGEHWAPRPAPRSEQAGGAGDAGRREVMGSGQGATAGDGLPPRPIWRSRLYRAKRRWPCSWSLGPRRPAPPGRGCAWKPTRCTNAPPPAANARARCAGRRGAFEVRSRAHFCVRHAGKSAYHARENQPEHDASAKPRCPTGSAKLRRSRSC